MPLGRPDRTEAAGVRHGRRFLPADGKIDARGRKFLQRLSVTLNIQSRVASQVIEAMLVKNHI